MNIKDQINAMIDDLADNPDEIKAELEQIRSETPLCRALQRARLEAGFSQRALAKAAGMSTSKICRMESGVDADLTLGEITKYIAPLGMSMSMLFDNETQPASMRIKHMVLSIGNLLGKLAELAEEDPDDRILIDGIYRFRGEVLYNFLNRYKETTPQITIPPPRAKPAQAAPTTPPPSTMVPPSPPTL